MLEEVAMMGICAFCTHGTHDYPSDRWHNEKHDKHGWHSCEVNGGFRANKPLCEDMAIKPSAVVGWA